MTNVCLKMLEFSIDEINLHNINNEHKKALDY